MSGGNSLHGTIIGELSGRLFSFVRTNGLGRVITNANFSFVLERTWSPVPDIAFVSKGAFSRIFRDSAPFDGPPDLAVEVTSPSNSDTEIALKTDAYLRAGSVRVWIVRPELETVTVVRPDRSAQTFVVGESLTSEDAGFTIEGFSLLLADLFAITGEESGL